MYVRIYEWVCVYVHVYTYVYMYVCMCVCMCVCVCLYVCTYVCACMFNVRTDRVSEVLRSTLLRLFEDYLDTVKDERING